VAVGPGALEDVGLNRRARVAVPPVIAGYPRESGVGKMWHHVVAELGRDVDVRFVEPGGRGGPLWRPQGWMQDGHHGPLPVRAPVVAQLHEAAWNDPDTRALVEPEFVAAYEEPSRAAARAATRVVTPSESSRRQIIDAYGVPAERVVVARHGVDHTVFHPGAPELVARVTGDADRPYVVFVSQLHPRKNLAALREAMTRLARRGYPHALVVVGGHPADRRDAADLVRLAASDLPGTSGRVTRLEALTEAELAGVLAGAAAFCLPSFMEGFGLTALEAMACAVPVVVSDRGALPEVVGDAGIVTAPTADAVEAALVEVLDDDARARALGKQGYERSLEFTWARTAACWRVALDEALATG
jgi:glycosyltransferase involved in cell wall biosynthesis